MRNIILMLLLNKSIWILEEIINFDTEHGDIDLCVFNGYVFSVLFLMGTFKKI